VRLVRAAGHPVLLVQLVDFIFELLHVVSFFLALVVTVFEGCLLVNVSFVLRG
jgi:hypothetical protein